MTKLVEFLSWLFSHHAALSYIMAMYSSSIVAGRKYERAGLGYTWPAMRLRMRIILTSDIMIAKMEVIMIITLAIYIAQVSVPRSILLLRCGDIELNPGPGRYSGIP